MMYVCLYEKKKRETKEIREKRERFVRKRSVKCLWEIREKRETKESEMRTVSLMSAILLRSEGENREI
jgi:hypothetical protein